jgi:hypothetical protein
MGMVENTKIIVDSVFEKCNLTYYRYTEYMQGGSLKVAICPEWDDDFKLNPANINTLLEMLGTPVTPRYRVSKPTFELSQNTIEFNVTPAHFDTDPEIIQLHNSGAYFTWGWENFGFGQFSVSFADNKLTASNETLSRESVRKLLHQWADYVADRVYLDDGMTPPKHIEPPIEESDELL